MSVRAVFQLELSRAARREKTYWLRTIYVAFLATVVSLAWLSESGSQKEWTQQESVGHYLFVIFAWVQFVLLNITAPVALAGAISEEKNRRTLPLLLSSPLSNIDIITGKLLAGMIPVFLLLTAGLPIMFLLLVFGGLSPLEVVAGFALTIVCAAVSGSAALYFSSIFKHNTTAFGMTAAFVAAFSFLPDLAGTELLPGYGMNSPFAAFGKALAYGNIPEATELVAPAIVSLAAVIVFLLLTAIPFRSRFADRGPAAGLQKKLRKLFRRLFILPRGDNPEVPENANPVFFRGTGGFFRGVRQSLQLPLAAAAIIAAIVALDPESFFDKKALAYSNGHARIIPVFTAILMAMPLMSGARAFSSEKEKNTLDTLLSTPMDSRSIYLGKVGLTIRGFASLLAVPALYGLFFAGRGTLPWWGGIVGAMQLFSYGLLLAACGITGGLLTRRPSRAAVAGACLFIGVNLAFIPLWFAARIAGFTGPAERAAALWWVTFGWPELLSNNISDERLTLLLRDAAVNIAIYILAAMLIIKIVALLFERITGRAK